ncbi:MAG: HDIG domain-containing protein [Candidatus Kerfeldbacteria bacterium]|nr:HDIG domain-containing protein [Candidatus Kerfeldbacteria bacterium]
MRRFSSCVDDLLRRPEIRRLALRRAHHFSRNRLQHCLAVAKLSFYTARLIGADSRTCARAALLHDWYFENRGEHRNRVGANVHHPQIAADNARGLGEPTAVIDIIQTHMWPYGGRTPRSVEAWIVWMADNLVWVTDLVASAAVYLRKKVRRFLYGSSREQGYAA